ncbi:hypothetical protein [Halapricum hydrolyticum]|uniref:Uncharacterized protein n=1 Tax=Halapricum hydrolyticum TaxID=2979991 RepID=A0AAE3LI07_9EURY|nr:hypothetical protein [Halapricum hydrolyticum]MCU4718053.1 hypothetical protein [Halapricum hydrolyticum]MCU4727439.1 hypothetical protein [Halapricum hydrolyticum]
MPKPDIEVLDDGDAYPYSSHISVDGTELQLGDLLLVFDSPDDNSVSFFERVFGFTWPGIITHVVDGPVPAEFHNFEDFAADLDSGKIAVASKREQTSFFVDDDTVRTITLYRYQYQGGWQPIVIDERRNPLEDTPLAQSVALCDDGEQVIEELLLTNSPDGEQEFEHIQELLVSAGYRSELIPAVNEVLEN